MSVDKKKATSFEMMKYISYKTLLSTIFGVPSGCCGTGDWIMIMLIQI